MNTDFNNGWTAYSLDAWAVGEYHRRIDQLDYEDRASKAVREAIWNDIIEKARESEGKWNALSDEEKAKFEYFPFWKRGVGTPRRLDFN